LAARSRSAAPTGVRRWPRYVAWKRISPVAAAALIALLLAVDDGALAIAALAGRIARVPVIYGPDVNEIARAPSAQASSTEIDRAGAVRGPPAGRAASGDACCGRAVCLQSSPA